jgi:hypothetical protein
MYIYVSLCVCGCVNVSFGTCCPLLTRGSTDYDPRNDTLADTFAASGMWDAVFAVNVSVFLPTERQFFRRAGLPCGYQPDVSVTSLVWNATAWADTEVVYGEDTPTLYISAIHILCPATGQSSVLPPMPSAVSVLLSLSLCQ